MGEDEGLKELARAMMESDERNGSIEQAIIEVNQNLTKIESLHDVSELPFKLIEDVYKLANVLEATGKPTNIKFSSDSKRRLLDSIIKIKTVELQTPRHCEDCPNNLQRIREITEDRKRKSNLVKELADKFIPKQQHEEYYQWLIEPHLPIIFTPIQ